MLTIDICVFVLLFWLPFESFYSPIVVSEFIKIQIQRPSEKYFAYLYKIRRVRYETECKIPVVRGNVELRCKKHNKVMVRSIPPPLSLTPWQIIPSRCLGLIPSESYVQLHAPVEWSLFQVWCKHSLFQVSCGLTYAQEYVHCLEYDLHIDSAYSHNATSKMSQVSCSIPIYSLRNVGKLKTVPSTQLLLRWHIVPAGIAVVKQF